MKKIYIKDSDKATITQIDKKTKEVSIQLFNEDETQDMTLVMSEDTLFGLTVSFNKICAGIINAEKEGK